MKALLSWRPDLVHLFLLVILVGGATVRFVGVDFGLPLTIKSDEPIVVGGVISMLERNSFEPDRFQWPNHLGIMATYLAVVFSPRFDTAYPLKWQSPLWSSATFTLLPEA